MADLDFPLNPQVNDIYTFNNRTFKYDGSKWRYVSLSLVTVTSGSAITSLNSLTNSAQDFFAGVSGSGFNISSVGNTHTFNIPIAGSGTTGLITTASQTIAGSKTFSSAIIGDLTGTATTSNYSLQSGYAITSGSAGIATTATNLNVVTSSTNATHYILFSPVNGGSGVAVSSDTGLTFNPASNTISLSTLSATTVNSSTASISGSTASTSPTTGAVVVTGGVGIGQSISIGGRLQFFNGSNYTAFVSSATGNTVYTLPASSPATGSSVLQSDSGGTLSWVPMTATGGGSGTTAANVNVNSASLNASHFLIFSPTATGSGVALSSESALVYNPSTDILSVSGLAVTSTTASTSTSNGALQVAGGVGISGRLSFNQASFGTTGIATNPTMAMIGQTGDPIFMSVLEDNSISFEGTQGQLFSITPNLSTGYIYSVNDITGIPLIRANANANVTANEYAGNFGIGITNPGYKLHVLGAVGFTSTTVSTSTTTGTLVVGGGVGIGGSLYVASATAISGVSINNGIITGNLTGTATTSGFATTSNYSNQSGYGITAGLATTAANLNVVSALTNSNHPVLFTPTSGSASGVAVSTESSFVYNPSTDILSVSGLAITATTASTNSSTGALVVTGGVGIGGSLYVAGDLTINGTTTTINTVTLTVDDKNIELGSVSVPSDVTAEGGGITLKGATDKSINWYSGTGWSSSESWNLASGGTYKINNTTVLSNSSLGTGVTNSSLTALGTISTGVWSGTLITSLYGGTGYNSYTKGDLLVGAGNTFVKFPVGNNLTILTADTASGSGLSWKGLLSPTYGAFGSTSIQQVSAADTETLVTYNLTYEANNVTIGSGTTTRVYINDSGVFNIQFSAQVSLASGNQPKSLDMWFKIDGVNVPQSNTRETISGKDEETIFALNFVSTFLSGQYVELAYSSPDANMQLGSFTGLVSPTRPDIPSMILTVTPVSSILPGSGLAITGLASLNLLTANAQTLVTGTSGVDFNINSTGSVHTFNIPDASTTARGLLTTGAQTLLGIKTFGSGVAITATTASTSTTTGALIVSGGVGIGQSASVGGRLQLFNGANYTAFVSSASGNTVYTLPATSPATGSSVLQSTSAGVLSWVPMTAGAASGNTAQNIVVNTAGNANVFHPILFTPSSLSAGSAVSSDSTISFNPSTEILNVSGLAITSGTASTNTTTGALVVRGGLGVTGQLSFAQASFGFTGITTNPTMSFIGATSASPITLTVLTDNSLNFEGSQGSVFSIDSNLSSGEIFSVSDISGLPIISASAGQTVNINEFGGYTQIGNGSINSSSTTTGSLVVSGGLGLTGNANIGGTVRITNTTASTTSSSGALVVSGGVGIGQSASIGGRLLLFNGANYTALVSSATGNTVYTLPATSPATGSSVLQSTSTGVMSWVSTAGFGASVGGVLDGSVQYKSGSGFGGTRSFLFNTTTNGLRLGNYPGEELPTSTSAALLIEQTIGSFNGNVNGTLIAANAISGFTGDLINLQVNAVTRFKVAADGAIGTSSGFNAGGDISVTSGTNSSSTTTGALQVRGGVGITGNAFIGGTTTITNTTASVSSSSGALVVAGGVGIGQTLFIGGNLYQNTNAITAFNTGFRNRIINGDGFIDQRSDGSSTTPGVGATNFIDRWKMNVFGSGRLTIGKNYGAISSPDGFVSYIGMKTTTTTTPGANDYNFLSQVIEGVNTIDLQWGTANAKPITLSFWAYSSLTGTFGGSVRNSGTFDRSYPFTYTISSSNTWEKKTVVIPGDTTGTWTTSHLFGIELIFIIANGTTFQSSPGAWASGNFHGPTGSLANLIGTLNATLYLTGIQAEIGSVATPYERRNYGHEFSLCQRYYQITEVRTGGYHTALSYLRGSVFLNTAARPISSPVFTVLSTDESFNHGTLSVDNSNFRGDSFRYLVQVTVTGDAFGQWKVGADFEF
jgi:hypothetical protein